MRHLIIAALVSGLACRLSAASVSDIVREVETTIDKSELDEHGNSKRAEALTELLGEQLGLSAPEQIDLRLVCAEAWVGAGAADHAEKLLAEVLHDQAATAAQRERAGLAWVVAWQVRLHTSDKPDALPLPTDALAAFGEIVPRVAARIATADGERRLGLAVKDIDGALAAFDQAIDLLKQAPPVERVPVYALRLLAMEAGEKPPKEITDYLAAHASDPAVNQVAGTALTGGQRQVGQMAPALKTKRLDGQEGEFDLSSLRGKVVLISFFATWAKTCEEQETAISGIAAVYKDKGLATVSVSLDTKETLPNLPAYIAKHGIEHPVVGDGLGWDSLIDDAFNIEAVPQLIVISADGHITAVDLAGADAEATAAKVGKAVRAALGLPDLPAAEQVKPAPDAEPEMPAPEAIP